MAVLRGRASKWIYGAAAAMLVIALLFWLEWLGSEQPLATTEVSVSQPVAKQETGLHVKK